MLYCFFMLCYPYNASSVDGAFLLRLKINTATNNTAIKTTAPIAPPTIPPTFPALSVSAPCRSEIRSYIMFPIRTKIASFFSKFSTQSNNIHVLELIICWFRRMSERDRMVSSREASFFRNKMFCKLEWWHWFSLQN